MLMSVLVLVFVMENNCATGAVSDCIYGVIVIGLVFAASLTSRLGHNASVLS